MKKEKREFSSTFTSCNLNDHIPFNLGRGRSRDHLSRVNCQRKIILHINKQLETKVLGIGLNLEKMSKVLQVSVTHALIQVRNLLQNVLAVREEEATWGGRLPCALLQFLVSSGIPLPQLIIMIPFAINQNSPSVIPSTLNSYSREKVPYSNFIAGTIILNNFYKDTKF